MVRDCLEMQGRREVCFGRGAGRVYPGDVGKLMKTLISCVSELSKPLESVALSELVPTMRKYLLASSPECSLVFLNCSLVFILRGFLAVFLVFTVLDN